MCPQKFVKEIPPGYTLIDVPENFLKLKSGPHGFDIVFLLHGCPNYYTITPDEKIAVMLPDRRFVIPTVRREKG